MDHLAPEIVVEKRYSSDTSLNATDSLDCPAKHVKHTLSFASPMSALLSPVLTGPEVYHIALTGGPCGGKSTALLLLAERLRDLGFYVYAVPEVATLLNIGGATFRPEMNTQQLLSFEASVLKAQMALEDSFIEVAKASGGPAVVLSDRGTLDVKAYMDHDDWQLLMNVEGWMEPTLRERYTAVFHLVSAAVGAEEFYTLTNNTARRESLEEARELDARTRQAWVGHPKLKIFNNEKGKGFNDKINLVLDSMLAVVGLPSSIQSERRFLISREAGKLAMSLKVWGDTKFEEFEVKIDYLLPLEDDTGELLHPRLMKRGQKGIQTYNYGLKKDFTGNMRTILSIYKAETLSGKQYLQFLSLKDPDRNTVKKKVRCFLYNQTYFTFNHYLGTQEGVDNFYLLEAEDATMRAAEQLLPKRLVDLGQYIEVTGDKNFTSFGYSKKLGTDWDPYKTCNMCHNAPVPKHNVLEKP